MYCEHFGLAAAPFSNTPDPRFFFRTPDHEEALASLLYVAQERKGFAAVTGEVGTGKTLLSRMVLARLPIGARTAMLTHTGMNGAELLSAICSEFQLPGAQEAPAADLFQNLEDYLLEQYARDRLVVVVLDEAQNLPVEAFEQLRMLGNLEAEDAKLLQVLILGQPELMTVLARNDMRQMRQRIYRTYELKALSPDQTAEYIAHRLSVAGAGDRVYFEPQAVEAVHRHSRGLPRLINQLCDNGMLVAYGQNETLVAASIIHEVAAHIPACMDAHFERPPRSAAGGRTRRAAPPTANRAWSEEAESFGASQAAFEADSPTMHAPRSAPRRRAAEQESFAQREQATAEMQQAQANLDQELAQARELRVAASQLMTDLRRYAGETRSQLSAVLTNAEHSSRELSQRMADAAAEAARSQTEMTRQLLSAARSAAEAGPAPTEQAPVVQALERHFEAVRGEFASLAGGLQQRMDETEQRTLEVRQQVRCELDRLPETLQHLSQTTAVRTHAARGDLDNLLDQARAAMEATQARFRMTVDAADMEVGTARAALQDLRRQAEQDTAAMRSLIGSVSGRCESLLGGAQQRFESMAVDVQARSTQLLHDTAAECRAAIADVSTRSESVGLSLAREREDLQALRERLDQQLRDMDERLHRLQGAVLYTDLQRDADADAAATRLVFERQQFHRALSDEVEQAMQTHREASDRLTQSLSASLSDARRDVDEILGAARLGLDDMRSSGNALTARFGRMAGGDAIAEDESGAEAPTLAALNAAVDEARKRLTTALAAATSGAAEIEARIAGANRDAEQAGQQAGLLEQTVAQASKQAAELVATLTERLADLLNGANSAEAAPARLRPTVSALHAALRSVTGDVDRMVAATAAADAASRRLETAGSRAESAFGRLDEASEESRLQLADIVREAQRRVQAASEELDRVWAEHSVRVREFKQAVDSDLSSAGREATLTIERAQSESRSAEKLIDAVVVRGEQALTALRERLSSALAAAEQRVGESGRSAELLAARLNDAVQTAETEIVQLRSRLDADCLRLREDLTAFDENSEASLDRTSRAYTEMNTQAEQTITSLQRHVGDVQQRLSALWDEAGRRLGDIAGSTGEQAEQLRREAQQTFEEFGGRLVQAEQQTTRSLAQADSVVGTLNAAVREAEVGLRSRLEELTQRGDAIGRDLSELGRQARETAEKAGVSLRDTVETAGATLRDAAQSAVVQIEEQRAIAQREARTQQQRLAALLADVDNRGARVRQDARELLNDAQRGAAEIREQAAALMGSTRGDAEKIAEQAGRLLEQARTAADAFREQAESMMRRAETSARELESQVQHVRQELGEDRREMRAAVETAAAERGAAHARTQELLARAEFVQDRTLNLLELPRQVLDEAKQRSEDLRRMSQSIQTAVVKLAEAGKQADQRSVNLQGVEANAAKRMDELQTQTHRVGQLLVVLRQLYSRMDARIEHMRDKLGVAENLANTLPGELQLIRTALTGPGRMSGAAPAAGAAAAQAAGSAAAGNGRRKAGHVAIVSAEQAAAESQSAAPRRPAAAASRKASLGELVEKNERLNAWLKQQIENAGKSQQPEAAAAAS